jgi:hypothetical protein
LFKPPYVIIKVDGKDFELPKALLSYHSKFFDRAFNGDFKEGVEQAMEFKECSKATFEFAIQWIYTGQAAVPDALATKKNEILSLLIEFLRLADRIDLLGPFHSIVQRVKETLAADSNLPEPKHIRFSATLPQGHPLRHILALACVPSYLCRSIPKEYHNRGGTPFRFQKELDELEGFALDMMKALSECLGNVRETRVKKLHPITGKAFDFYI